MLRGGAAESLVKDLQLSRKASSITKRRRDLRAFLLDITDLVLCTSRLTLDSMPHGCGSRLSGCDEVKE